MMEDDPEEKDDNKRRTRNLSEKKRRDQFNSLVNELSTMVSANNRKMDKSTVLKSTIAFLKNHNEVTVRSRAHDVGEDWKPAFLSNEEFTYLVLEALEGFLMVFSASGVIHYVSEGITSLLGHNPAEVVNKNIYDIIYEDDRPHLYNILQSAVVNLDPRNPIHEEEEICFQYHMARGSNDPNAEPTYDLVQFNGHFRTNMENIDNGEICFQQDLDARVLFVCTGRLHLPHLIRDVSLVDSSRNEFTSRHSLEWKFLFLDHRAPPIIGYMPFEVLGTSGYDYYHFDDIEKMATCHENLMDKGELTSSYYRFLTKGQQWIWLQTRFYITYHQWSSKPEFIVCTHRVVSQEDIAKNMKLEQPAAALIQQVGQELEQQLEQQLEQELEQAGNMGLDSQDLGGASPSFMSDRSDAFGNSHHSPSQCASVKSASAGSTCGVVPAAVASTSMGPAGQWSHLTVSRYRPPSDTASVSGESRSSHHRNNMMETHSEDQQLMLPQHGILAAPAQYVGALPMPMAAVPVSVGGVIQLPMSSLVSPVHAQLQEQLQRKHEELQQMIVRQQEELRQVKEQLLMATLGILPPIINVQGPYMPDEMQVEQMPSIEAPPTRPAIQYPAPQQPPPHNGTHPNMPQ